MNLGAQCVIIGIAGLLLAALFATAALTNGNPPLVSQPLADSPANLIFRPSSSAPIVSLGASAPSQPLKPGVYQTRPDAIVLVVPKRGLDDRLVVGAAAVGSNMPVVKPQLRAVPIPPSK